jgi:hypothetical protein
VGSLTQSRPHFGLLLRATNERLQKSGLANSRFSGNEDHLPLAAGRLTQHSAKMRQLAGAARQLFGPVPSGFGRACAVRSTNQSVAAAMNRLNIAGIVGRITQRATYFRYVYLQDFRLHMNTGPYRIQQLIVRDNLIWPFHQDLQYCHSFVGQVDLFRSAAQAVVRCVKSKRAE